MMRLAEGETTEQLTGGHGFQILLLLFGAAEEFQAAQHQAALHRGGRGHRTVCARKLHGH
ncbi:hypothetical protein D1872_347330 [compost metagenome]